jgi:hypothetical protein
MPGLSSILECCRGTASKRDSGVDQSPIQEEAPRMAKTASARKTRDSNVGDSINTRESVPMQCDIRDGGNVDGGGQHESETALEEIETTGSGYFGRENPKEDSWPRSQSGFAEHSQQSGGWRGTNAENDGEDAERERQEQMNVYTEVWVDIEVDQGQSGGGGGGSAQDSSQDTPQIICFCQGCPLGCLGGGCVSNGCVIGCPESCP